MAALRILVADDEPDMRDYFRKVLPRLGHTVVAAAETGAELIAQCRTHRPDLVITDIKMPELDGIDAATARHCSTSSRPSRASATTWWPRRGRILAK